MQPASITMWQLISLMFISAAFASVPPEILSEIREYMIELGLKCMKDVGASYDDISPILKHQVPVTETGKCFTTCIYKELALMNRLGKIDKMGWHAMLDELKSLDYEMYKTIKPMVIKCLNTVTNTNDPCETGTNILGCMFRESNCDKGETCIFDF